MSIKKEAKQSLLFVIEEMAKETKLAEKAPLYAVKKHIERLGKLQQRFNIEIAKAVCYG